MPELGPYEIRLGHTQVLAAAITGMALPPGVSPASVMALLASAAAVSAAHNGTDAAAAATGTTAGGSSSSTGGALGPGGAAAAAAGAALGGLSSSANEAGAGGAAGGGGGGGGHGAASTGAGSSTGEGGGGGGGAGGGAAGRAHTWPAIRAGLDGMGLDSTPVSRCRQCVLQLPGEAAKASRDIQGRFAGGAGTRVMAMQQHKDACVHNYTLMLRASGRKTTVVSAR